MGNFIQIDDKLALKSDSIQWMICKKSVDKKGETVWNSFLYPGTLPRAVRAIAHYLLDTGSATSITELRENAETITDLLNQKFSESVDMSEMLKKGLLAEKES